MFSTFCHLNIFLLHFFTYFPNAMQAVRSLDPKDFKLSCVVLFLLPTIIHPVSQPASQPESRVEGIDYNDIIVSFTIFCCI